MGDLDMEPVYAEAEDAYDTFVKGSHFSSNGIRAAVDAARPLIEAAVREQVAAQLGHAANLATLVTEGHASKALQAQIDGRAGAYATAARIARGEIRG